MKKRESGIVLAAAFAVLFLSLSTFAAGAITLTEPRLGVANQSTFNITVASAAPTTCRYSSPFEKPFSEMTAFTESSGTITHRLLNYNPQVSSSFKFFAECANAEKGSFELLVDPSPPAIVKAVSVPSDVIETPFQARLVVETNKNTTCRYGPDLGYDAMSSFFKGSDDVTKDNYENDHEVLITGLADKTSYTYNVSCLSLSHLLSSTSKITFKVDTSVAPAITMVLPSAGSASVLPVVKFSVTTNKRSVCTYGNTTEYKETGGNFSLPTVNHGVFLQFEPGKYKYYVKCLFEGPKEVTSETSFSVDNTAPTGLEVNDSQELPDIEPGYTYRSDQLLVKFKAVENESSIDFYNFSIVEDSSGKLVYGWVTTTESKLTVSGLKLKDSEKYYVYAYAQNKAGLRSETARSSGVVVNILLNTQYACKDNAKDGDESDVDCGGSCSSKCSNGKSCVVQSDCKSAYCVDSICKAGSCTDSFRNQDETDVDCGGSCKKCEMGNACRKNSDCDTSLCTGGICVAEGPCSNKRLDPGETDVDCGGVCVSTKSRKCLLKNNCLENSDCSTGLCNNAGKCASLNDRDSDGILNDADLCPEVPNTSPGKKQADADGDKTGDDCDLDNDNDGMPDEFEKKYGFNAFDSADALADPDKDGLSNLDEFKLGTSPKSADTDKDGADDGREVEKGSNPKDAKSKPKGNFAFKATLFLFLIAAVIGVAAVLSARRRNGGSKGGKSVAPPYHPPAAHHAQHPQTQQPHQQSRPAHEESQYSQHHYASRHDVFDELQKTYSQMSGEELFEHLKRKTGRR